LTSGASRGIGAATARPLATRGQGRSDEVARAMPWLLADDASFIAGSFIEVGGGC